ncbi:Aspartic peptidase domain [Trinorchestia longiramus]|nr:Aspartic peptidase domain [Trinorchestia longiramus]
MALVDTGCTMTVVHSKYIAQYDGDASISAFDGRKVKCKVAKRVKIVVQGGVPVNTKAVVSDRLVDGVDVVLGTNVIDRLSGVTAKRGKVEFGSERIEMACPAIEQATKKEEVQGRSSLIFWKSKRQNIVALSSCEAEYIALTYAVQEGIFLKQLLCDMDGYDEPVGIFVDNRGAIDLAKNPVHHQRS